ncbi:MAG: GNAT family N-acetyltransferase [Syntrophobacteraceae bacterium]
MSIHNLKKMFEPAAIAAIGGCSRSDSTIDTLIGNLRKGGFAGKIFPVTAHQKEFWGIPAFPALDLVRDPVDLALIASPLQAVPAALDRCSESGATCAVIFADGEELSAGARVELIRQIKEAAHRGSVRIIGPGSSGISFSTTKLNAIQAASLPLPGRLAFISQSRTIFHAILDLSIKEQIGFSTFISIGGMQDVDFADLINFFGNDDHVGSIALCLEEVTSFRKFMSAARAVSRIKPIIALKYGRARPGEPFEPKRRIPTIGQDDIYGAAFKRAGIERVNTFAELFDCAELLAKQPRPSASRLVIITNGRGPAMMAADALADHGVGLTSLQPDVVNSLSCVMSPSWTGGNPVDLGTDASPQKYARVVEICLAAPEIEALLIIFVPGAGAGAATVAESLVEVLYGRRIPVYTLWLGATEAEQGRQILNRSGLPTFDTPERAIKAFLHMGSYAHNLKMLQEIPEKLPRGLEFDTGAARTIIQRAIEGGQRLLGDEDSKFLLSAYGIPAGRAAGVTDGYELMLGARRDPGFGPVLLCGAGGMVGEIFSGCALALPPLNRVLARQLIEASGAYQLLKGNPEQLPELLLLLEEILIRLSQLVTDFPEVIELEINPLVLSVNAADAMSASAAVQPAGVASPQHLVISSYPSHYETEVVTEGGIDISLRPIKPEDAPLLVEFFHSLSPTSVYFRFFCPLPELPLSMLTGLTQVDYDRDIVVVASKQLSSGEKILGVARLMGDPDVTSAEFAIAVGDLWHKKGVGAALLERAIHIARERGLESIFGTVMPENKGMLAFARSHGFSVEKISGSKDYEVRVELGHHGEPNT